MSGKTDKPRRLIADERVVRNMILQAPIRNDVKDDVTDICPYRELTREEIEREIALVLARGKLKRERLTRYS